MLVVGYSWVAHTNWRLRHELEQMQAKQENLQRTDDELRRQVTTLQERVAEGSDLQETDLQPGSMMIAISLTSDLAQSGGKQNTLYFVLRISQVRLLLNRERDEYSTYKVVLETVDGIQIWKKQGLLASPAHRGGRVITVEMPANVLQSNDYVLKDGLVCADADRWGTGEQALVSPNR